MNTAHIQVTHLIPGGGQREASTIYKGSPCPGNNSMWNLIQKTPLMSRDSEWSTSTAKASQAAAERGTQFKSAWAKCHTQAAARAGLAVGHTRQMLGEPASSEADAAHLINLIYVPFHFCLRGYKERQQPIKQCPRLTINDSNKHHLQTYFIVRSGTSLGIVNCQRWQIMSLKENHLILKSMFINVIGFTS